MLYWLGRSFFKIFFIIFLKMKVEGSRNIPSHGGFIVAGNHASYLDPIVFGTASSRPLNFMARDTLFKNPFFGWILRKVHAFPLKRNSSDIGAIKEALKRIAAGYGLLLFPEGTRSPDGSVGRGLAGVGFLARKSKAPVIPAYVFGTEKAMPKGAKFLKPTRIKAVFGEAVTFTQADNISDEEITSEIMRRIACLKESA